MRLVRVAAALLCAAHFSSVNLVAQTRGLGAVSGSVTSEGGDPVAGATVKFMLPDGETIDSKSDAAGKWRVGGLGKGEWRVMFAAEGYASRVVKFIVERETLNGDPVRIVLKKA